MRHVVAYITETDKDIPVVDFGAHFAAAVKFYREIPFEGLIKAVLYRVGEDHLWTVDSVTYGAAAQERDSAGYWVVKKEFR